MAVGASLLAEAGERLSRCSHLFELMLHLDLGLGQNGISTNGHKCRFEEHVIGTGNMDRI